MTKTSKEYAEKLAKNNYYLSVTDYYKGYLKAIEETRTEELLDALNEASDVLFDIENAVTNERNPIDSKMVGRISMAIQRSTEALKKAQ